MHQICGRCTKKCAFIIANTDFRAHFSFFCSKALSNCTKWVKMLIFCEFLFFGCFLLVVISRQARNDTFFIEPSAMLWVTVHISWRDVVGAIPYILPLHSSLFTQREESPRDSLCSLVRFPLRKHSFQVSMCPLKTDSRGRMSLQVLPKAYLGRCGYEKGRILTAPPLII